MQDEAPADGSGAAAGGAAGIGDVELPDEVPDDEPDGAATAGADGICMGNHGDATRTVSSSGR